jgi:hypothetical protein
MDMHEIVRRTAWQAGASEDIADRLVEAFLHEVREALGGREVVDLGAFGRFEPGGAFAPGPALTTAASAPPFGDVAGYDEGTAPSDS